MKSIQSDKTDLQNLIVNNPEFEQLEHLLSKFNLFEALGIVHQEIRHSDFLAFLLNAQGNHGLGDIFVKRLLQEAIGLADFPKQITPLDLALWNLNDIEIRREWHSIDILVLDNLHKLAFIIENKIHSGEHDDQLARYKKVVTQNFPGYDIIGIFLSPDGQIASDNDFISINYGLICKLLEDLLENKITIMGQDIITLVKHYIEMLRRHIVGESEIENLCHQIYRKHQRALDLIYEYRPDQQAEIRDRMNQLINSDSNFVINAMTKSSISFIPKNWDSPVLQQGYGWSSSGRMLLFELQNRQDSLKLHLILGPGPDEIRQMLFDFVIKHEPPFKRAFKALGKKWSTIFSRDWLREKDYQDKSSEELFHLIEERWRGFLEHDLHKLDEIILPEINSLGRNG